MNAFYEIPSSSSDRENTRPWRRPTCDRFARPGIAPYFGRNRAARIYKVDSPEGERSGAVKATLGRQVEWISLAPGRQRSRTCENLKKSSSRREVFSHHSYRTRCLTAMRHPHLQVSTRGHGRIRTAQKKTGSMSDRQHATAHVDPVVALLTMDRRTIRPACPRDNLLAKSRSSTPLACRWRRPSRPCTARRTRRWREQLRTGCSPRLGRPPGR